MDVADVTDEASVEALFRQGRPVDIVVANAGRRERPLHPRRGALWDRMIALNRRACFPDA